MMSMDLRSILIRLINGEISIEESEKLIKLTAIEEVGEAAKLDVNRQMRSGVPEIILAEGKSPDYLASIITKTLERSGRVILSRLNDEQLKFVQSLQREFLNDAVIEVNERAHMVVIKNKNFHLGQLGGRVGILTAGTADIPIAEEARIVAREMGCEVFVEYDVGVAGLHRLFPPLKRMLQEDVDVLVVVAGREGALPSVVAGLVDIPVIGVPTSIGYGLGGKGEGALMAMLQSCSLGLAVVNIDGGSAAGAVAAIIANRAANFRKMSRG